MQYQYWLSNIEGIGSKTIKKIGDYVAGAEELYRLSKEQIRSIPNIREKEKEKIIGSRTQWNLEKEWELFLKKGIGFVSMEQAQFPEKLRHIENPPYSIYYKGSLPKEHKRSVAIVGARGCSEYGRMMAEKIAEALAAHQVEVISGMARGVDSYAHIGALRKGGETFAVLGCGVDVCYPPENRRLYEEIIESGGVLSEYAPQIPPKPQLFPMRNRIISALSDAVLLVEAKEKSGSLITADYALEQGKDIFACPGRATDALSTGCNALIRQGAGIITSVSSLLKDLGFIEEERDKFNVNLEKIQNLSLEKDVCLVYSCLDFRPQSIEMISMRTGLKASYLSGILLELMQKELAKEIFRNYYIKNE